VDVADVHEALESLDLDSHLVWGEIHEIHGGWSYWTFAVEPDCIFRFPRRDEIADDLRKEVRLLPELAERVSFDIPRFEWRGRHSGRPFVGYRRVPGRPLRSTDIAMSGPGSSQSRASARERLAQTLAELHGFPKRRAGELLQIRDAVTSWTEAQQALRSQTEERVLPLLSPGLRAGVVRASDRFQAEGLPHFSHPVLVHADLGMEHVLVEEDTGLCTGLIDFETATLGDPVIDFVGLWNAHGKEVTGDVLARYGGPHDSGFGERLHFYQWMGSVHAILHGLRAQDDAIVRDGIETLEARIQRSAFGDPLQI
jgi:aminoglycoside 2''-phosphotransferase